MRCTEEAERSQLQVVTGNTARMVKAVKMFGNATGFVCFNVSAIVDGRSPDGLSFQRDSQLSTSYVTVDKSDKSLDYWLQKF